jgi:hypothetical protein
MLLEKERIMEKDKALIYKQTCHCNVEVNLFALSYGSSKFDEFDEVVNKRTFCLVEVFFKPSPASSG